MVFPVLRENDFMFKRNYLISRNKGNKAKLELKNRYLDDCFSKCPVCDKQELIEVVVPERNVLRDFCLNLECGYKKEKEMK